MPIMQNQTFLDLELCEESITINSDIVDVDVIDLTLTKEASCNMVIVGKDVCYTVTIVNNSDVALDTTFRDPLALNTTYVEDSFTVKVGDEEPVGETPSIDGDNVMTHPLTVPANETVVVEFCVTVDSATPPEPEPGDDEGDDQ